MCSAGRGRVQGEVLRLATGHHSVKCMNNLHCFITAIICVCDAMSRIIAIWIFAFLKQHCKSLEPRENMCLVKQIYFITDSTTHCIHTHQSFTVRKYKVRRVTVCYPSEKVTQV